MRRKSQVEHRRVAGGLDDGDRLAGARALLTAYIYEEIGRLAKALRRFDGKEELTRWRSGYGADEIKVAWDSVAQRWRSGERGGVAA
jgi:hypothetical protein